VKLALGRGLVTFALAATVAMADPAPREVEVQPGDSLARIARQLFGDASLWPVIYGANRDRIKDPTRVYPGQRLVIPELDPEQRASVSEEALEPPVGGPPAP